MSSQTNDIDQNKYLMYTGIASIGGSIVAKLVCHPFDTLKSKLQIEQSLIKTQDLKNNRYLINSFKTTLKNEGIKGLYSGIGISILGMIPAISLYYMTYEWSKVYLAKNHQFFKKSDGICFFVAGIMAEAISCIFWLPIDIVKERLQVQHNLVNVYNYKNSIDACQQIIKNEGIRGLYKAYGATLCSFGPFSALYFLTYEKLKAYLARDAKNIGFYESMFFAAVAGSIAGVITNPLDMSKIRMQVQRGEKASKKEGSQNLGRFGYKNMFHGIYLIYTKEGFLSLYKGSFARILYHTPNTAITMSLVEWIRKKLILKYEKSN